MDSQEKAMTLFRLNFQIFPLKTRSVLRRRGRRSIAEPKVTEGGAVGLENGAVGSVYHEERPIMQVEHEEMSKEEQTDADMA